MTWRRTFGRAACLVGLTAAAAAPAVAEAQATAATALPVEPSGRATTAVSVVRRHADAGEAAPLSIRVDYGQPHARGRVVVGNLIPYDQVWRTGANEATAFVTEVDLEFGGKRMLP